MDKDAPSTPHHQAQFVRTRWYQRGLEYGNPYFNERFRVNAPETSLIPAWMYRSEARENGMMLIRIDEDLALLESAELYAEIWGGHPGTANKRVSINGRSTYKLPEVGTAAGHCTHSYPHISLKLSDLVNGYNAIQFGCDMGSGFWGHFIVDNASINVALNRKHPELKNLGVVNFDAGVAVKASLESEDTFHLNLVCSPTFLDKVSRVDYIGHYSGYDENGNGLKRNWHGYTKNRRPEAIIGTAHQPPFNVVWDTAMLAAQVDIAVRAIVQFHGVTELAYETEAMTGLDIPVRECSQITPYIADNQPIPFWSRDGNLRKCVINLDISPGEIEQAELHVIIWDGGAGTVQTPFSINEHALNVAGLGAHDVIYRKVNVQPSLLKQGINEIKLLSDTKHHGIEILLPGPCLVIRRKRCG